MVFIFVHHPKAETADFKISKQNRRIANRDKIMLRRAMARRHISRSQSQATGTGFENQVSTVDGTLLSARCGERCGMAEYGDTKFQNL